MFSLTDLLTPLTRDQVKTSIYDVLAALGVNTTTWKPGAVVRTLIAGVAIVIAALSQLVALIAQSAFLDYATGNWLTLVARYVYGVERVAATFAAGEVTLTNSGGGVYVVDVDDLVVSNPSTGKTYRNSAAFTLGASSSLTIAIVAEEAGSASTSTAGTITTLVTPLLNVTCTNASAVVGADAESDPTLRARCREKLGSLSPNGPWDAYTFAAKSATRADGTAIGVTRTRIVKGGYGNIDVYCATATGTVSGTVGDLTTDLGRVDDAVQRKATPLCVTADTHSAGAVTLNVTYEVWMYNTSGLTPAEVQALINTALGAFTAAQPIGGNVIDPNPGKVFVNAIRYAIFDVRPEIFQVVVTVPAADVQLAASEVAVLGAVTCTAINQVAAPEGY